MILSLNPGTTLTKWDKSRYKQLRLTKPSYKELAICANTIGYSTINKYTKPFWKLLINELWKLIGVQFLCYNFREKNFLAGFYQPDFACYPTNFTYHTSA